MANEEQNTQEIPQNPPTPDQVPAEDSQQSAEPEEEHVDAGEPLVSWETWEFLPIERGARWYLVASLLGVFLIVYGIATSNPLFSLIILMIGVMMFVNGARKPKRIMVHVTTGGVVVGEHFYPYDTLKDFSIIYKPPEATILYIDFKSWTSPLQRIELESVNPIAVREALLPVLPENYQREDELLTDLVKRVYKL